MPQLSLFESSEVVVVDDRSGRIAYLPQVVAAHVAEGWFAEVRRAVPWNAERRWQPGSGRCFRGL
jgi:hypothetical protein